MSPQDELDILLRAGDLFAAGPGLDLVIADITRDLTHSGKVLLELPFTNGLEGVYTLDLPEPPLAALALGALAVAMARRARPRRPARSR